MRLLETWQGQDNATMPCICADPQHNNWGPTYNKGCMVVGLMMPPLKDMHAK